MSTPKTSVRSLGPDSNARPDADQTRSPSRAVGCYSTARVRSGRVERVERHAQRLRRDAERLGLHRPDLRAVEAAFLNEAERAFPREDGIVRVEWSTPAEGPANQPPTLIVSSRELGSVPSQWRVAAASIPHPGRESRRNTKSVAIDAIERAREEMRRFGLDEVWLFDSEGYLVEGGHSNCFVVDAQGVLHTPALRFGGVEGLGMQIVRESFADIQEAAIRRSEIESARELLAVNGVRGVVPIVEWEGRPVANGQPGNWARRLSVIFAGERRTKRG